MSIAWQLNVKHHCFPGIRLCEQWDCPYCSNLTPIPAQQRVLSLAVALGYFKEAATLKEELRRAMEPLPRPKEVA